MAWCDFYDLYIYRVSKIYLLGELVMESVSKEDKVKRHLKIIEESDFIAGKAVIEEIDTAVKRKIMFTIQKAVHTIDSYAKYVNRRLIQQGIYCDYVGDIIPLPDGFRVVIEFKLTAVDKEVFRKAWRSLYYSVHDYTPKGRVLKATFRKILEGELVVGGGEVEGTYSGDEEARRESEEV